MARMRSVLEHDFLRLSLLQTIHFYTIQTFRNSALDMDTNLLTRAMLLSTAFAPGKLRNVMEIQDLTRRSVWHMGWEQRLSDDDDTASGTEELYITMIDQVCQSVLLQFIQMCELMNIFAVLILL